MAICCLIFGFPAAYQGQTADGSVDPDPAVANLGDVFTVLVNIDPNDTEMSVAQVAMRYDPAIVQVNTVSLVQGSPLSIPLPGATVDNTEGFFFIAGYGFIPPTVPFSHVQIEFTAIGVGNSTLEFETEGLLSTGFSQDGGNITGQLTDGFITINGPSVDCPNLGLNINDPCDDGDPNTENDAVTPDCDCIGTPICAPPFPAVDENSLQTTVTPAGIVLSWQAVPGQIGCQVKVVRGFGPQPFPVYNRTIFGSSVNSFTIPFGLLPAGGPYGWRVRCGCSANPIIAGPFTAPWEVFSIPALLEMDVSPNPAVAESNISFHSRTGGEAVLEIYDLTGRLVDLVFEGIIQPEENYQFSIDLSDLPNGIYLTKLSVAGEVSTKKLFVAK